MVLTLDSSLTCKNRWRAVPTTESHPPRWEGRGCPSLPSSLERSFNKPMQTAWCVSLTTEVHSEWQLVPIWETYRARDGLMGCLKKRLKRADCTPRIFEAKDACEFPWIKCGLWFKSNGMGSVHDFSKRVTCKDKQSSAERSWRSSSIHRSWGQSGPPNKNMGRHHHHQGIRDSPESMMPITTGWVFLVFSVPPTFPPFTPILSGTTLASIQSQETLVRAQDREGSQPDSFTQLQASPRQHTWTGGCGKGRSFHFQSSFVFCLFHQTCTHYVLNWECFKT